MKKFLTILVVFTVVCGVANAKEIDPKSPVGIGVMKTGSVCKLFYKGEKAADVKVTIVDAGGSVVFTEVLHEIQDFMRPYNFSTLKPGEYTIVVEGENGRQEQTITFAEKQKETEKVLSLIRLSGADDRYVLNVPNKGLDELKIEIFTGDNRLVYKATEKIDGDFAKIYNLDNFENNFFFQVTDKTGKAQTISYLN